MKFKEYVDSLQRLAEKNDYADLKVWHAHKRDPGKIDRLFVPKPPMFYVMFRKKEEGNQYLIDPMDLDDMIEEGHVSEWEVDQKYERVATFMPHNAPSIEELKKAKRNFLQKE